MKYRVLSNGVQMPGIGFGTYKALEGGKKIIEMAIAAGYRHFDTAAAYGNEEDVGEVIRNSGIDRSEFFITSKVWPTELGYDRTMASFQQSLQRLQTTYLDLFLIHWPKDPHGDLESDAWKQLDQESWRALEDLYRDGKVRAIGVSNFLPHHLLNLMKTATVMPMVDQLEIHPGYSQIGALDFCRDQGILAEAWSPIGRGRVLQDLLIQELAQKYHKNAGQICLKYVEQLGAVPLPKSSSLERMKGNLDIDGFTISEEDMYRLMTLPQLGWSGQHPDRPWQAPEQPKE